MYIKISRVRLPQNLYLLFIILYTLLNNYKFVIPIGDIIGICLIPYFYIKKRSTNVNVISDKLYIIFIIYCIITLFIGVLSGNALHINDIFSKSFHLVLYGVYALYFGNFFNTELFFKKFIKILNILVALAIIQQLIYILTKNQIYLILPGVPLNYSVDNYDAYISIFKLAASSQGYRASSLFLEPAHFALIVVIGLAYRLLQPNKKSKDFLIIMLYLLAIIFSYSTGGALSAVIVIIYYLILYKADTNGRKDFLFKIGIFTISVIGIIFVLSTNSLLLITIQNRINSIGSTVYDTTGNRRVLRGYYVWKEIPFFNKIFGTGMGNLLATIESNGIKVLTDSMFSEEMSALFYILCSVGIVGTILYFFSIIKNWKNASYFIKLIIILYLFSCIFNNIILHATSVIYLSLIFSGRERNENA